jgi:hypothetical protein
MMVKAQFGVNLHSQIFDTFSSSNQGFTQFVIEKAQVRFPGKGDNSGLVDVELHKIRHAPSTNTLNIRLKKETVMRGLYFSKDFDFIRKEKAI